MLFEQFQNIILEYKQDITAKKMGPALLQRFLRDPEENLQHLRPATQKAVDTYQKLNKDISDIGFEQADGSVDPETGKSGITSPEKQAKMEEKLAVLGDKLTLHLLNLIEEADPTKKNNYVQWLIRTYINDPSQPLEDVLSTVSDYLGKFHKLKIKNHLTNADIGQYKSFETFFDDLDNYSSDLIDDKEDSKQIWNADPIYDEDGILILSPKDEEAACHYGRGTRWCTSATRANNYFQSYNRRGPLYIIAPRKPTYPGEKYQFHFQGGEFKDEKDDQLRGVDLIRLTTKYPGIKNAFVKQAEKDGLLWLQKPKQVVQGENFELEEYRKDNKPLYLLKPTDPESVGEIYAIEKDRGDQGENYSVNIPGQADGGEFYTMNLIDEHKFYKRFPDVARKFGLISQNINLEPTLNTTDKLEVETHNKNLIMTDPVTGLKSAIVKNIPPIGVNYYPENLKDSVKLISTSPFKLSDDSRNSPGDQKVLTLNPYEYTKDHPELIDLYTPTIKNLLADSHKAINNNKSLNSAEKKEKKRQSYIDIAPYLPYKVYDKPDVYVKSHVNYKGQPIVDYVISKNDPDNYVIVDRDPDTGEVLQIKQVESRTPSEVRYGDEATGDIYNKQNQVIGNIKTDPDLKRLYGWDDDHRQKALGFLPTLSFLEQYPGLKELYTDTKLSKPKLVKGSNANISDYGKIELGADSRDRYADVNAESMRNYVVKPNETVDGESFAISWSPELPQYAEVYYSDKNGKQVKLENTTQIRHIIQAFPELNKLHEKDYQALLDKDYSPGSFSQHRNRRYRNSELIPDYAFNPTEVIDNARVEVKQFGPQENATHSLPMFEVFPKEKNPFGEIGARFTVRFTLKDQRGKFGKISNIHIKKLGKTPLEVVPVDQQGNTSIANGLVGRDDNEFIPVSTKSQSTDKDLNPKEVNDFFKYYPELRRLIKDENIHPKIPHPALATKPPEEEEEVVSTGVAYSNFTLDEVPSNDKEIKKYYIEPNEAEYEGEFYTMYVVDPVLNTPSEKSNQRVRTRDDENGSGSIFISQGEERGRYYSGYGDAESTKTQLDNLLRGGSTLIPSGTPEFNAMLSRFPDLKQIIAELAQEVGAPSYQQIDEDQIKEIGQNRVYAFNNKDGSKYYVITPIANPRRGEMGEIESYFPPDDHGNEVYPNSDANKWNDNSYIVDFKSTEQHPNMQVSLLVEPFKEKTVKQLANYFKNRKANKEKNGLSDEDIKMLRNGEEPEHMDVFNKFKGATTVQTRHETTNRNKLEYLQDMKTNPELYSYFQDLAEKRNAETSGIGQFINFLPLTSNQLSDAQTDVPKLYGIDLVGIAKIGTSNPLYIWQGREEIFNKLEYYASDRGEITRTKYNMRNQEYKDAMNDATGENVYSLGDLTFAFKPESGGKFLDLGAGGRSYLNAGTFTQIPNATFLKVAPYALNLNNIIKPKEQKELGLIPSKTWTPRTIAAMPEKPKYKNNGKPWIKSIEEFKMPEGLGHNLAYYGDKQANKFLAPGTAYLVTLNPITDQPGPRKRKDGKLVKQMSPHTMLMRMTRDLDLPWEFEHNVLGAGNRDKEFIIYFANNRVAYILQSGGSFEKYNFTQEQKKNLFFDEEYGIFPETKSLFDQYAKSNKWLRENRLIHDVLLESLGDKTHWELQKKMNKPNYGKLIWLKNQHLSGSYDNNKLKELGFFMKNGEWVIQQFKFDQLVKDNKLKEMINRPLVTGKAKIPNVGRKKVHENVWAFDAEKALELLKEPLLRGGGVDDPDLGCDMCGGHGCGAGYDIKDDLARYEEMLDPNADTKPEHLANDYIQKKIERLKAIVQKYPNGIPDNIDCSGGMSNKKHREWNETKGHDAADVLYDIIGDDSFHDMLYDLAPEDDVRPLIMNWLNPSWRAEQRKGLPEYPAVEDVDFAELYKRARQIYNPLTLVKEGKKFPRTSEFLFVRELEDIKRLAGVYEPYVEEGDGSMGSNISKTANKISNIMKEKNIQPGTPEWFQLWFSKPYLTGEKPYGE